MKFDAAIVGAGPAGLSAAIEIAKNGGEVVIIDDHPEVGGKLNGQLHEEPRKNGWWIGLEIAKNLKEKALSLGVKIMTGTQVWSIEPGWKLFISSVYGKTPESTVIDSKALLLATGAVEKPLPIPGWTLPGVLTVGGAQVLTNQYHVKPGKNVIVIGIDILSLSIARAMKMAGANVIGIYMAPKNEFTEELSNPKKLLKSFQPMARYAPNPYMRAGGSILKSSIGCTLAANFYPKNGMKAWGIPIHFRQSILKINGEKEVESVLIAHIDSDGNSTGKTYKKNVDAVCISGGLTPQNELAASTGCRFVRLHGLSGVVPLHDEYMNTSVDGLFVAGNITGVESAKVAAEQGKLAGKSLCKYLSLGLIQQKELDQCIHKVEQARRKSDIQFHPNIVDARKKLQMLWEANKKVKESVT